MQGAQELRSEAHLRVRRNDEVEAQRRRWTFYETIKLPLHRQVSMSKAKAEDFGEIAPGRLPREMKGNRSVG
jgi:hypothetical protein